jgi:hypothetical protein
MSGPFIVDTYSAVVDELTQVIIRIKGDADFTKFRGLANLQETRHTRFQPSGASVGPTVYDPVLASIGESQYGIRAMGSVRGPDYALSTPNTAMSRRRYTGYTGSAPDPLVPTFEQLWSQVDDYVAGKAPYPIHPTIAEVNSTVDDWLYGRGSGDWAIEIGPASLPAATASPIFATSPVLTSDSWVPIMRTFRPNQAVSELFFTRGPYGNRSYLFNVSGFIGFKGQQLYWMHGDNTSVALLQTGGIDGSGDYALFCAGYGLPPAVEIAHTSSVVHLNADTPTRTLKLYLAQEVVTLTSGSWGYVLQTSALLDSYIVPKIYTVPNGSSTTHSITAWAGVKSCDAALGTLEPLAAGYFYIVTCTNESGAVIETVATGRPEAGSGKTFIWHKIPPPIAAKYSPAIGDGEAHGYAVGLRIPLNTP